MSAPPLRVLVVDDSALYRKIVRAVLEQIPGVEVIGTAANGQIALDRIITDRPDAITLDLEMPELDGLSLLRELRSRRIEVATLVISSLTAAGAQATGEALRLGAFDFVLKPSTGGPDASAHQLRIDLGPRIEACRAQRGKGTYRTPATPVSRPADDQPLSPPLATAVWKAPRLIGIGVSTGGPVALQKLLPQFSGDFPCPIVIVQHMPPIFTKTLASELNRTCALEVVEGTDGMSAEPGRVILAPGGKQMRIVRQGTRTCVQITDDPPERNCRPAVDYLFRSIADQFGDRAWGVILTGMGDDGMLGCKSMKQRGAKILAQDEASCVVYGMPRAVAEAGLADYTAPIEGIAARINDAVVQGALA